MIEIRKCEGKDKELLRNMFNLYQGELSFYFDKDYNYLDSNGYFDYNTVDVYFNNDAVLPFIIYDKKKNYGFIIISQKPYVKKDCDYCIQELFIIPHARGKKYALNVLKQITDNYKGRYCLHVLKKNERAYQFWQKYLQKNATQVVITELDEDLDIIEFTLN